MNAFERGLLRYLSPDQFAKLQRVSVGIAGAGGLGSNCAALLVRSGFKKLTVVDFDTVEASNLNRQFFWISQLGQTKTAALAENLRQINPDLHFNARQCKIGQENLRTVFSDCDVIVEALDRPEDKAALLAAYGAVDKLLVAASGLAGYGASNRIQTRRFGEKLYVVGDMISDVADMAPFAPCVMIAAAKQADVVLAYVLNEGNG